MPKGFVSFAEVKRAVTLEAVLLPLRALGGPHGEGREPRGAVPFLQGQISASVPGESREERLVLLRLQGGWERPGFRREEVKA